MFWKQRGQFPFDTNDSFNYSFLPLLHLASIDYNDPIVHLMSPGATKGEFQCIPFLLPKLN